MSKLRLKAEVSEDEMRVVRMRAAKRRISVAEYIRQRCIYDLDVNLSKELRELPQEEEDATGSN